MVSLNFGKYIGFQMNEIPQEYLEWCVENLNNPILRRNFIKEKTRRESNIESVIKGEMKVNDVADEIYKRHLRILKFEAYHSGCSWEYDNYDFKSEAEALSYIELQEIDIMVRVNEIRQEFIDKCIGFNLDVFKAIEHQYFDNGRLYRNMFSSNENYLQAVEYMQKIVQVRGHY